MADETGSTHIAHGAAADTTLMTPILTLVAPTGGSRKTERVGVRANQNVMSAVRQSDAAKASPSDLKVQVQAGACCQMKMTKVIGL